jgi:hypothetical protein
MADRDTDIDELARAARVYTRRGSAWARPETGGEIDAASFIGGLFLGVAVASAVVWIIAVLFIEDLIQRMFR